MATIREKKRKNGASSFYVEVRLKGHPPVSGTFERKTDARLWAQKMEAEIRAGRYFGYSETRKKSLADVMGRYANEEMLRRRKHPADVKRHLDWWKQELGEYRLCDLRPALIVDCREKLLKENISKTKDKERYRTPATVNRYLATLSVALTHAVKDWGWMEENPALKVRKLREPRGRVRFLTEEERKALLRECQKSTSEYIYPIVILALTTGARAGEISSLTWFNVDLKRRVVTFEETKNGERRSVPLASLPYETLKAMAKNRRLDTPYVFPREDGRQPVDFQPTWKRIVKRAGLTDFKFHDLRHTAASYLAMAGSSLLEIADILGHKTLAMVKRYSHLSDQHTATVLERMSAMNFQEVQPTKEKKAQVGRVRKIKAVKAL